MVLSPSSPPGGTEGAAVPPEEQATALLELTRELVLELHPHNRGAGVPVSLDSVLDAELGFDSLGRAELMLRIDHRFGVTLPDHVLATAETPRHLLQALTTAQTRSKTATPHEVKELVLGEPDAAPVQAGTLVDVLDWHVARHPARTHIYLYDDEGREEEVTYGDLHQGAEAVAAGLLAQGLLPRQTVAIMLPTDATYFHTYYGILLAGGIPVPIYPPARLNQLEDHLQRHVRILNNAQVPLLVTIPEAKPLARLLRMQVETLRAVVTVAELTAAGPLTLRPPVYPDDIAFIQYTSGSTGSPKGVVLTHANLLANIRGMAQAAQADATDVFVSWLPLYHDMGLIGAWLGSLYISSLLVLMSPLRFLARPERWLWAIHQHRATISPGVNFAYELCVRNIADRDIEGLRLDSWRLAFNGAEPVSADTLARFEERFKPYGFRPEAATPVYGLAESSLGVTIPPLGRRPVVDRVQRQSLVEHGRATPAAPDDSGALRFVACGRPLAGHQIRIVDEGGRELGEREEGRLEFMGPSTTSGYYRNPEATRELFNGAWLNSGDLAYIAEGDLYLTGRIKDIIIRGGRNIYPHELEEVVGDLPGVRKGCVAAFGVVDRAGRAERLVVLAETRETDPAALAGLEAAVRTAAFDLLALALDEVVLAPPHSVLKTSSGKVRRGATRELYEQGLVAGGRRAVWVQVVRLFWAGLRPEMRRWRRAAVSFTYSNTWWAVLVALAVPAWLMAALSPRPTWTWALSRRFARAILRLTGTPLTVRDAELVPPAGQAVFVVNHGSYLDGFTLIASLPHAGTFIAKRELLDNFVTRIFLRRLGTVFVERFDMQRGVEDARRAAEQGAANRSLIYFPEGTLDRVPGIRSFHMGAFIAAVERGLPVVPVTLRGTRSMLRDGQWRIGRGALSVRFSAPLFPDGSDWAAAIRLRDAARAEILRNCGEPDIAGEPANP